jgi:bisanhydrobacterioruberin hydratase
MKSKWLHKISTKKNLIAVIAALMFHFFGGRGMMTEDRSWFIAMTPLNLTLMCLLLWWTYKGPIKQWYFYFAVAFFTGYFVECIGVNTSLLFGHYQYGNPFGLKLWNVPLLIGIQWFVTTYCIAHCLLAILERFIVLRSSWIFVSLGAILTTLFDYIIEPVAISLGYWDWKPSGVVPLYNYICWFGISALLFYIYWHKVKNKEIHYFAIILLGIQIMFFLYLR